MHQHHWYTLFKGIADGLLLEDWVTDILLPLSLQLGAPAMRISSCLAGMEMLATGTTCSLNHSVTTTTPELVAASIEPQAKLGIRQVYAKELRCRTPGNPRHSFSLDEALDEIGREAARWDGKHDGPVRFGIAIESNAHWVAAGMSTEELICRGHELAKRLGLRITAHIAGGTFSLEKGFLKYLRETGRTDVRYLMQLGILDPQPSAIELKRCSLQ
jgi:5-methylthioadenosine/S-adenosylhomocysteine deaminase